MTVMDTYKRSYELFKEGVECCDNKYEWAASEIFGLATYDGNLDELFVKKIVEVCQAILDRKTYEYIEASDENYIAYIITCQLLRHKDWIDWGTSIRGAFFNKGNKAELILYYWKCGDKEFYVPFNEENIRTLIEFMGIEEDVE
jgi:hypothetical protein